MGRFNKVTVDFFGGSFSSLIQGLIKTLGRRKAKQKVIKHRMVRSFYLEDQTTRYSPERSTVMAFGKWPYCCSCYVSKAVEWESFARFFKSSFPSKLGAFEDVEEVMSVHCRPDFVRLSAPKGLQIQARWFDPCKKFFLWNHNLRGSSSSSQCSISLKKFHQYQTPELFCTKFFPWDSNRRWGSNFCQISGQQMVTFRWICPLAYRTINHKAFLRASVRCFDILYFHQFPAWTSFQAKW